MELFEMMHFRAIISQASLDGVSQFINQQIK